ncbi:protein kinase domain-containing protein [Massilia aerilata]|uniref:Protein kinase n=1 Tax=Massilia aerilata TaxID=453817 RepID=A0ABW0RRD8_9BURK
MLEAGDIITLTAGAWRLREPLASSSYGLLWHAEPSGGGPPAVLKLVNTEQMALALPPQRVRWSACLHAEIAFLGALRPWDQRHIVRLLDSGEHLGQPAMALERLDTDLARHLDALRSRGDAPSFLQALDWAAQANQALAKVHQYGWRHLDLKPANLLLDRHGALKLADFGTNRPLLDRNAHSYAGSANWQAPEQFFPGADGLYLTDARSDYFALGALLYHVVSGAMLRFCSACGGAWREHGPDAAASLRARHAGGLPAILAPDEAALYLRHAGLATAAAADAALGLLRALLAPRPERRPRHALEISRLIERARSACAKDTMRSAA